MTDAYRPLILTIDDEESIRSSFRNFLEDYDYRVVTAGEGETGIQIIEEQAPDLVLVDLRMPRCDGLDVLAWIRDERPSLPVIVVSGTGVVGDVIEALKLGAWDYLLKPVRDLEMLKLAVERALEKAELHRQADEYQIHLEKEVARRTEALRAANEDLNVAATAFETRDAILITDPEGVIVRANAAMAEQTGYLPEEMIGNKPRMWHSGMQSSGFYQQLWNTLRRTGEWQGELWNRHRNGGLYPVWQRISAVRDDDGEVRYYVGIATDLSELKAKEQMLEHRAREERVLGGLAKLSMEQVDTAVFMRQSISLLREHLDNLCLHSRAQLWRLEGDHYLCHEVFPVALDSRVIEQSALRQVQSDGHPAELNDANDQRCLLLPIGSQRKEIGVLALYCDCDCQLPDMADFLSRLCEVFTLALLHQQSEREMHYQANHDSLTGLPNRQLVSLLLDQQLNSAKRRNERGALLFLDLDNFKTLNDSLGHSVGDRLLQALGERIRETLREEDILSRLGGDEFVIVLPPRDLKHDDAADMALQVSEKVREATRRTFTLDEHEYQLGVSIGVAIYPDAGHTTDELLKHADAAMYQAKAAGRDSIRFYEPELQHLADRRLYIERKLRRAMELAELEPFFQAQLDRSGAVVGAEVLMRWRTDADGWISPGEFIPVAEDTGLIIPISNWQLEDVCRRMKGWLDDGAITNDFSLSVNISPNQFYMPGFASEVLAVLSRLELDPAHLTLEITEGVVLRSLEDAKDIMSVLQGAGIRFSLDDFGTGYSSLAYLKKLPVNELKIDQSFIFEIDKDPDDAKIVDAILSLAGHFSLSVVAEGVETNEALELLRERGCDGYQGFFFSRPLPEQEFLEFVKASAARKVAGNAIGC